MMLGVWLCGCGRLCGRVGAGSAPSEAVGFACGAGANATVVVRTTFPLPHEESWPPLRREMTEAMVAAVTRAAAAMIAIGRRGKLSLLGQLNQLNLPGVLGAIECST